LVEWADMQIHVNSNVEKFIQSLEKQTIAKVLRTIDLLETFGHKLGMPHSKMISKGLFELRIRGKQEIRIFYSFYKDRIHLLHGFVKKSQKTPQREIDTALQRLKRLTLV